jgi:hypothetical protein
MIALAALAFTVVLGFYQKNNANATLEVARSNCELARTQVKASLLPQLSNGDANVRLMSLSLAKALDKEFAAEIAGAYALNDVNEKVRQKSQDILQQYNIVKELRRLGLSNKLQEARFGVDRGTVSGTVEALRLYHEILNGLSSASLENLERGLLIDAQEDEKRGYKEFAARKYRSLFKGYEE